MYFYLVMAKFQHLFIYWILTIWQAQNKSRTTLNSNMPLLFFQGTSRIYLIIYQVLGNSLHCQETDDLRNFQFHRLEFLHIHRHYHSHLGLLHIYLGLCSNSKNSDILKFIIVFSQLQVVILPKLYNCDEYCKKVQGFLLMIMLLVVLWF